MEHLERRDRERAVAAYYDRLAPVYGDGEYFRARRQAVLTAIAAEIEKARTILDLGCGNGAFLAEFVARTSTARITGADLSPEMLRVAHGRLGERVALLRADASALPLRAGSVDLVFMSHVLLMVGDIERCVAEVARSLTRGGVLVATVGAGDWREMVRRLLGPHESRELEELLGQLRRARSTADDRSAAIAACGRAGLQAEWRDGPFSVTWPAIEEWVRVRWLTIADDALRERAERWLATVRPRAAGLTLSLAETLLVAHR